MKSTIITSSDHLFDCSIIYYSLWYFAHRHLHNVCYSQAHYLIESPDFAITACNVTVACLEETTFFYNKSATILHAENVPIDVCATSWTVLNYYYTLCSQIVSMYSCAKAIKECPVALVYTRTMAKVSSREIKAAADLHIKPQPHEMF